MQTATTRVLRNGEVVADIPAAQLVPGDVVDVRVGDKVRTCTATGYDNLLIAPMACWFQVPADCRIIKLKTTTIKTDEGALTGESETVMKQVEPVEKEVLSATCGSNPLLLLREFCPSARRCAFKASST